MKIQSYDILAQVIPGYIVYTFFWYFLPDYIPELDVLPSIGIAYFIGYFVNILSNLLERIYHRIWKGSPSDQLLNGQFMNRIRLEEWEEIKQSLERNISIENPSSYALFGLAKDTANNGENDRVRVFNDNYAFSRSLLTSMLIISILVVVKFYYLWQVYPCIITLLILCNLRAKQRGFYYAKEILTTYWHYEKKEQKEQMKTPKDVDSGLDDLVEDVRE